MWRFIIGFGSNIKIDSRIKGLKSCWPTAQQKTKPTHNKPRSEEATVYGQQIQVPWTTTSTCL
jgi:hypothetical protein